MYSLVLMMALSGSADMPAAHGCHGCCGGCYGCHGCHGGKHKKHGCHGCHGCCGGSYGCCGGGCCGGGCCGGYSCTGCTGGCGGMMVAPAAPVDGGATPPPPPPPPPAKKELPKKEKEEAGRAAPATIFVSLPADAKLTIDNTATASTSATRVFATPALEQGKEYFYTLKAQVTRDGKVLTATQRIAVRAGETSRVALEVPTATGVASK